MDWFSSLFFGTGIAHSIFVLALAIAIGIFLGAKLKFKGITLGITWILFCAIACSHFGMTLDPQKRALTSAAGPFAALLCAFALVAIAFLVFRATIRVQFEFGFLPIPLPLEWIAIANSKSAFGLFFGYFIFGFIWSSVFWSFFNLLPIYPMDGGQILYNVLVGRNGSSGRRTTYLVSIVCSTAIAVYFLMDQMFFNAFMFAYFAVFNYRIMKASGF